MIKILVVGQTPPPYHGQAIMIEKLLSANFRNIQLYHVRLQFSKDIEQIGRATLYKVFHLFFVIMKIIFVRFRHNVRILYYPPAGKNVIPMVRDIIILLLTRPFFTKTIFHFHAGGVSELINKFPTPIKFFVKAAYREPDVSIRLSKLNPEDGKMFKTKSEFIIPYGLEDSFNGYKNMLKTKDITNLLYVGVIKESKGIFVLLESFAQLSQSNRALELHLIGGFDSKQLEESVRDFISVRNLPVKLYSVLFGSDKFKVFQKADIFCFPSFYEAETFGIVLLEAMMFELPIVATCWRGIPDVVIDGENGFLVPIKNSEALTEKLELLIRDKELRKKMGMRGRQLFLEKYSMEKHIYELEKVFNTLI